ncbi:DNA-3-methyladenine glycosylase, partial [Stutzerimonas stutzeri]|uniref:DNA-3-methyladenine glycosylase n=1 Tax=Stutzerimonas stutzeri TaxID=316 RepID=UPI0015E30A94
HPCVAALRLPGRMAVEQVARWPWNAWPDESGLGGRMAWNPQANSPAAAGGARALTRLCSGQTLLCKALGLSVTEWNARRMDPRRLRVDDIGARPDIIQTTRLGIPQGRDEHLPYRFVDAGFAPHCTRNPLRRSQCEGKDYVLLQRDK